MKSAISGLRPFLVPALTLACACAHAQVGISPRFDADYTLLPQDARPGGGVLVHDYGAFALWRLDNVRSKGKSLPHRNRRIDLPSC